MTKTRAYINVFIQFFPRSAEKTVRAVVQLLVKLSFTNMLQEYHASFFHFLLLRFSIMCRTVFSQTITQLRLAGYEMTLTNSALRASLVILSFHI